MKKLFILILVHLIIYISHAVDEDIQTGIASFYSDKFHGKMTASGEIFNKNAFTAAHQTIPFHSILKVTNLQTLKSVYVRINDRGPFIKNRILDLSEKAAKEIDMFFSGTAKIHLRIIEKGDNLRVEKKQSFRTNIIIGTFKNKKNVINLQNKLINHGFKIETIFVQHPQMGKLSRLQCSGLNFIQHLEIKRLLYDLGLASFRVDIIRESVR